MEKNLVSTSNSIYRTLDLPTSQAAANQLADNNQCQQRMAQAAVVSAVVAATHGLIDVWNPRGFSEPTSMFILVAADPGAGKTTVFGQAAKGFSLYEAAQREKMAAAIQEYGEKLELYEITKKAHANAVRRAINDGGDVEEAKRAHLAHLRTKPIPPKLFFPRVEHITPEALYKKLSENFAVTSLMSSEGMGILTGRTSGRLEMMNQIWSGSGTSTELKSEGSVSIDWARVSILTQVQPAPFRRFLESERGTKAIELGFTSRYVFCDPGSTQGSRMSMGGATATDKIDALAIRVNEILEMTEERLREADFKPEILKFSPDAQAKFLDIHNEIEAQSRPGGKYEGAGDHAARLSSNMARLAASLHFFEGFEGDISSETLRAAQIICEDASADYLKYFVPPPREIRDAIALNGWFDDFRKRSCPTVAKNFARKHCPNALRSEGRFYLALGVLKEKGVVREYVDGNGVTYLNIDPGVHSPFRWAGMPTPESIGGQ